MHARPSPLRIALLVAAALAPFPAAARAADGDTGRKYAVLVGVSEYRSTSGLRNLEGPANDVTGLRDALVGGGFRAEDITLLTSQAAGRLKPTGQNIRAAIKEAVGRCQPEDTLILAFAGHGLQFKGASEPYFCPYDMVFDKEKTDTLIPLLQVFDEVGRCPAKRKLLLVDACRVDPLAESADRDENEKAIAKGFALTLPSGGDSAALLSCSKGQVAWEDRRLRHGVFFHHVILGLSGEAADTDGVVTLGKLTEFVSKAVPKYVKDTLQRPEDQEPYEIKAAGAFPILRLASATEAAGLMREATRAESKGDAAAARAAYDKVLELDKKNAEAYFRRGLLSLKAAKTAEAEKKNEKYHEAARDFTKALKYKPDYIAAYLRRADANYYLNSLDAALQDYEEAIETDAQAVEVLVDRAFVYLGLEQPKKALADLNKAIEINPEYARAYYVRGAAKIDDKQVDDGLKDLDKAIEMDPHNTSFREYRLAISVKQGDTARIQKDETQIERVAAYIPASDTVAQERIYNQRTTVGSFFQSQGFNDRAEKVFERAAAEAEKMPALKARAIEGRVSQLEAAMAGGNTARANNLANQLKSTLPPNMRREFEKEWEQAKKEERWNRQQERTGPFGGGRQTDNTGPLGGRRDRETDNSGGRQPIFGGRERGPAMDNPGGRQPIFGGGGLGGGGNGGGGRPGRPGRP